MNKDRFSNSRLSQIGSLKELQATQRKVATRIEILEDKFEHGSWSLFNVDSMLYGLARKAAGIKQAWDGAKEIFVNLRSKAKGAERKAEVKTESLPEKQPAKPAEPKGEKRGDKAKEGKSRRSKNAKKEKNAEVVAAEVAEIKEVPVVESAEVVVETPEVVEGVAPAVEVAEVVEVAAEPAAEGAKPKSSRRRRGGRRRKKAPAESSAEA